ncbi:hypothetical protein CBS101457_006420 [Exobasidium rhododendri]|nr:hypothetical protein CBS101457_006420 [Exobasidium rhododendri]
MARITTIDESKSRRTSRSAAAPLPPPTVLPVLVLGLLSVLLGIFIHIKAVHKAPDGDGKELMGWSSDQARKYLDLPHSWPGTRFFDEHADKAFNYFLVLLSVFKRICVDQTGRALLFLVANCIAPFCSFLAIEGVKDGNSTLFYIGTLIVVTTLGQLICIGAAMPLFMGPLYAYARWAEIKSPDTVKPLPSPSSFRVSVASSCSLLALLTFFPTAFVSPESESWTLWNVVFQFFPLAWLPLLFFSTKKAVVSTPASAAARQDPRLSAALSYRAAGYVSILMYYMSLYYGYRGFLSAFEKRGYWANDGHHLLFWDGIGCLTFNYIIVLIDSYVDEGKILKGAQQRTHEKRFLPEDVIMGLPGLFILGPGFAMSTYFQRREILAEKVRFGIVSKDE